MFIMPNAELNTFQQQRKNYFSEFINSAALFRSMNSSGIMPKSLSSVCPGNIAIHKPHQCS